MTMTYWWINIWFLAGAASCALVSHLMGVRVRWTAIGIALVVMLVLTAVFDNLIIGFGLVDYDPALISGVRIGVAPLEDFAYTVLALIVVPVVWAWGAKGRRSERPQ
jgi:lycopene cyclase domain-containing protein